MCTPVPHPILAMSAAEYLQDIEANSAVSSTILPSDRVYKDDCMYNFDTPYNNALGLDVCLKCFQAFSRSDNHDYTAEHSMAKDHYIYLNINKIVKPREETQRIKHEQEERLRKAPKLEILETKEEDYYDTVESIYVSAVDDSIPLTDAPSAIASLARQIINANSANTADAIKTWEHEIFPCKHSESIDSDAQCFDLTQCSMCGLQENLWLCLTCGVTGCGREQFGSSLKGNSHALEHFQKSNHAVAVKLGSLNATDPESSDCYCYLCNEEVKVPGLAAKLALFGLDLRNAQKTEKSLVELNLETNKNWQFNLDGADGEKLVPLFGPGLTGMLNLGNTCYMNSVVQSLYSLANYREYFSNLEFDKSVNDPAKDLESQMIKLSDGLLSGRYSEPSDLEGDEYQAGIKISTFRTLIGADHEEFKSSRQQDANEFLLYFLDKLDKKFGLALNKGFKYLMGTKIVCGSCHHGSISYDLIDNISIPVEKKALGEDAEGKQLFEHVSVEEGFEHLTAPEKIDNYKCDHCGQTTFSLKKVGFKTFPEYLIVNLLRIELENWVPVKKDVPVYIPEHLHLTKFGSPIFENHEVEVTPEGSSEKFVPNANALEMLQSMGFGVARSTRALYNTGNSDAEVAMNWIFAHMEDADIDEPFNPDAQPIQSSGPTAEQIDNLVAMGFLGQLSKKALILKDNNPEAAVEWLFENPNDDGVIQENPKVANLAKEQEELKKELLLQPTADGDYELKAIVCHKGTTPHTGHYVAFIKNQGQWVLFNDEKVVRCDSNLTDAVKNGYIYFFARTHEGSK